MSTEPEKPRTDEQIALSIFNDFKWSLRIGDVTWATICDKLTVALKRARTELRGRRVREPVVKRLTIMLNRATEFVKDPSATPEICPKCHLNTFICPCPKE